MGRRKGSISPMKGKHHSPQTINKIKLSLTGRKLSDETKEKMSLSQSKRTWTKEQREKFMKNRIYKPLSEETKEKLRQANIGKKQSLETIEKRRQKIIGHLVSKKTREKLRQANSGEHRSEFIKKLYAEGKISRERPTLKGKKRPECVGEKISNRKIGHTVSAETREKISNTKKGVPLSDETKLKLKGRIPWIKGKTHSYGTKEILRQKRLNQVFPVKDSSIEIKLQNELKSLGIAFEKHKHIIGQPDIFIEPNICIFADGCYWHGCEQCFSRESFSGQIKYQKINDLLLTQKLENDGYIVLRFWEHDINDYMKNVVMAKIKYILRGCKIWV